MKKYSYSLASGGAALLVIAGIFSGLLPLFFVYAISLIFAYGGARYGKAPYMLPGLLTMGIISLVAYGPSIALLEIFLLAIYGAVLGISFFKRQTPEMIFLPSLAMLFATMLIIFYLQKSLMGVDSLDVILGVYLDQLRDQLSDPEMILMLRATLKDYGLSIIFLVALLFNLFICWIFSKLLDFRGLRRTGRFVFEYFKLRGLGLKELVQLFVLTGLGSYFSGMPIEIALVSLFLILLALFYVQGLSLLVYSIKARSRGKIRLVVLVTLSLFMPMVQFVLAFMGLVDQVKDFRKLEKIG